MLREWTWAGLVAIQSGGQGPTDLSQPRVTSGCFPEASGKSPPSHIAQAQLLGEDMEWGEVQQAAFRREGVTVIPDEGWQG